MQRLFSILQCESTNDSIADYIPTDKSGITALYTLNQTKGRGQYGNVWQHHKNHNLAITFAVPAEEVLPADSLFNYYTAILTRDLIANMTKSEVEIKWPNDLIIAEKKIAGILLERKKIKSRPYILIGIGINMSGEKLSEIPNSGSILSQTGRNLDIHHFASELFYHFKLHLKNAPSEVSLLDYYNLNLFRRNKISTFQIGEKRQNGIIKSANADGSLSVNLEFDKLSKFYHKEIQLLY